MLLYTPHLSIIKVIAVTDISLPDKKIIKCRLVNVILSMSQVPTMIVYGEKDVHARVSILKKMPNSEVFMMKNAGHACYMDDHDEWHRLLYGFLQSLQVSGSTVLEFWWWLIYWSHVVPKLALLNGQKFAGWNGSNIACTILPKSLKFSGRPFCVPVYSSGVVVRIAKLVFGTNK